jgi:hypothetical protein
VQTLKPLVADIQPDQQDHGAGHVGRPAGELAEAAEAPRRVLHAESRERTRSHHGERQPDAEAQNESRAQRHTLQLQTQQQHGDRRGTGDQPASEPEQHDLTGRDVAVAEAPANVVRVCQLVRILVAGRRQIESGEARDRVMMRVLDELDVEVMAVLAPPEA